MSAVAAANAEIPYLNINFLLFTFLQNFTNNLFHVFIAFANCGKAKYHLQFLNRLTTKFTTSWRNKSDDPNYTKFDFEHLDKKSFNC